MIDTVILVNVMLYIGNSSVFFLLRESVGDRVSRCSFVLCRDESHPINLPDRDCKYSSGVSLIRNTALEPDRGQVSIRRRRLGKSIRCLGNMESVVRGSRFPPIVTDTFGSITGYFCPGIESKKLEIWTP